MPSRVKRLRAYQSKRDKRDIVVRMDAPCRRSAHRYLDRVRAAVPESYRVEEEHVLGMRHPNGDTKGSAVHCVIVLRNTDTREPRTTDWWLFALIEALDA